MFFLSLGGNRHVVGTSPEKLVQVEGRRVEARPLAGTRRRGADSAEDARLERPDEQRRAAAADGKDQRG